MTQDRRSWRKSSHSTGASTCVQVRCLTNDTTELGDTQTPDGPTLLASNPEWSAFIQAIKADTFGR